MALDGSALADGPQGGDRTMVGDGDVYYHAIVRMGTLDLANGWLFDRGARWRRSSVHPHQKQFRINVKPRWLPVGFGAVNHQSLEDGEPCLPYRHGLAGASDPAHLRPGGQIARAWRTLAAGGWQRPRGIQNVRLTVRGDGGTLQLLLHVGFFAFTQSNPANPRWRPAGDTLCWSEVLMVARASSIRLSPA